MKIKTGNPNFTYEISCDQMCGSGHFSMRGVIIVETMAEYKKWLSEQKPEYYTIYPDKAQQVVSDSATALAKPVVAELTGNK